MSDINKNMTPPVIEIGVLGWMKKNLFSTWYNTVLTLIGLYFIYIIIPPFLSCLLYTSPSPRDATLSRMPSSA